MLHPEADPDDRLADPRPVNPSHPGESHAGPSTCRPCDTLVLGVTVVLAKVPTNGTLRAGLMARQEGRGPWLW